MVTLDPKLNIYELFPAERLDNSFVDELPGELPSLDNQRRPRETPSACYSISSPNPGSTPNCIAFNQSLAKKLDLSESLNPLVSPSHPDAHAFEEVLSGNAVLEGVKPYAMCYGGHQFGNWAGQLGDGRAMAIGELLTAADSSCGAGDKVKRHTLQLKGVGLTPYSRHADGMAVLRSSIREYLCSEAMHYLSVPTTRALSLCLRGDLVERDMFYDGHPQKEPAATVCRVSESFIRFGNFEIFSARGDIDNLKKLINYTIKHHFPDLQELNQKDPATAALQMFNKVATTTKDLIVHWQRVGFVHGVMNTDNMSILGQTIDYGPYGWLDNFDPDWTPNTTDFQNRRYRYANQAAVAQWNLLQLANALFPIINKTEELELILSEFARHYEQDYFLMRLEKLGLNKVMNCTDDSSLTETLVSKNVLEKLLKDLDSFLIGDLWDWTNFHRCLADVLSTVSLTVFSNVGNHYILSDEQIQCFFIGAYYGDAIKPEQSKLLTDWVKQYFGVLSAYIKVGNVNIEQIVRSMNSVNPAFILRNYISQQVIDAAHESDFSVFHKVETALASPYENNEWTRPFLEKRPQWALNKPGCSTLSCSS